MLRIIFASVVFAAMVGFIAYRIGVHFGEQAVVNRLLDAKDTEMWNAGHYVRADIKESKRVKAQKGRER